MNAVSEVCAYFVSAKRFEDFAAKTNMAILVNIFEGLAFRLISPFWLSVGFSTSIVRRLFVWIASAILVLWFYLVSSFLLRRTNVIAAFVSLPSARSRIRLVLALNILRVSCIRICWSASATSAMRIGVVSSSSSTSSRRSVVGHRSRIVGTCGIAFVLLHLK